MNKNILINENISFTQAIKRLNETMETEKTEGRVRVVNKNTDTQPKLRVGTESDLGRAG